MDHVWVDASVGIATLLLGVLVFVLLGQGASVKEAVLAGAVSLGGLMAVLLAVFVFNVAMAPPRLFAEQRGLLQAAHARLSELEAGPDNHEADRELRRMLPLLRLEIETNERFRGSNHHYLDAVMGQMTAGGLDVKYRELSAALIALSAARSGAEYWRSLSASRPGNRIFSRMGTGSHPQQAARVIAEIDRILGQPGAPA